MTAWITFILNVSGFYPDVIGQLHVQVRIMGNVGLNGGIPWIAATCFVCKQGVETIELFLLECPGFKENFESLWQKLKTKLESSASSVTFWLYSDKPYQQIYCGSSWKNLQDSH